MNFESNEFSIPDLTESKIATFFTDEGETEALASPVDLPAGYRNSKAEDKVASLSRYGLRLSEPQLERLRINGILKRLVYRLNGMYECGKINHEETVAKSVMLAVIPIDLVEAARILVRCIPVSFCNRN